ncbi:fasciclin domain-containing protein [Cellulophaga sp. L1A9]|uniref:fasciclin domain-containing protein n=1 Tax=Cellulophaga sp. L1A9 TaxID=2686362 RepID=UPI00131CFE6E|nr:fasciclin domain-containing protein [Cellulophaga sp. L1A9]
MKNLLRLKSVLLSFMLLSFALSCDNDDDDNNNEQKTETTIVETAQTTDALSSLVAALIQADENTNANLVTTLNSDGPFTVFAPTNDAFTTFFASLDGYDSLDDFDTADEKALLAKILSYHVVSGSARSTALSDGQTIETIQQEEVTIRISNGSVFIQDATDVDAEVISADVEASNGIVHVINKVLVPQEVLDLLTEMAEEQTTLVEIVVATDALSILKDAVVKTELVDTLNSAGPFTVFAPTNDAFVALLNALGDDYTSLDDFDTEAEIALLKNILLYHVLPAKVLAADLAAGSVGTAYADNSIEIIASDGSFVIGDASSVNATITGTDIMASNGVAHTIDKVLLPQAAIDFVEGLTNGTLVDIVVATEPLSILEAAVLKTDLVATLNSAGPFTVFAPTNDAFVALLDTLGDDYNSLDDFDTTGEIDVLRNILLYHVIPSKVMASALAAGNIETAYADNSVEIIVSGDTFVIGDDTDTNTSITSTDIFATNGVAHTIDKVLLPQAALTALGL